MNKLRTLDRIGPLQGKRVLLRVDLNLPMKEGRVIDNTRIERILPTVFALASAQARIVLLSHFGRPAGKPDPTLSLRAVLPSLEASCQMDVAFSNDCIGQEAFHGVQALSSGQILLLENTRFHAGEEENEALFSSQLSENGDFFVNDAFSVSHRAHASTEGLAHILPSFAGLSMQAELEALDKALGDPVRPVVAIVGGSKISTKIDLLMNLLTKVDVLVIAGAMASSFLAAQGYNVQKSLCEHDLLHIAERTLKKAAEAGCRILLPIDAVVARSCMPNVPNLMVPLNKIPLDMMILDAGPETIDQICRQIDRAATIVWNGPLGVFEIPPFDKATIMVARYVAQKTKEGKLLSIAGGGDTVSALKHAAVFQDFTYVSTAGGAFLEWMEGRSLPGVQILEQRS